MIITHVRKSGKQEEEEKKKKNLAPSEVVSIFLMSLINFKNLQVLIFQTLSITPYRLIFFFFEETV